MTQVIDAEDRLKELQAMHKIWLQIRNLLMKANAHLPISGEDEKNFLGLTSDASKIQRILHNKIGERVNFGSDRMVELLRKAVSLNQLRQLPEGDRRDIISTWHFIYVLLTRTLGEYQYYVDNPKVSGKEKFGAKKKRNFLKNKLVLFIIGGIIIIAIIIIIVVYVVGG